MPDSGVRSLRSDLTAGIVVFFVALPLCLGVAHASEAPLFSGILGGIVGGLLVGALSGSHTSVSGPAAGLTAVVAAQIGKLGSFEAFLAAVVLAGLIQMAMGAFRLGSIAAFVPSSVIKGLLASIGIILILKQLPHLVGHDADDEGEMAFLQPDHENTFTELLATLDDLHAGAAVIGLGAMALLLGWDHIKKLKQSLVPSPLVAVVFGVAVAAAFATLGDRWAIGAEHLVQVPVAKAWSDFTRPPFLRMPAFLAMSNSAVWLAALTIALVASLETLLNLEAVDRIDPRRRTSPPNQELLAQGVGNAVGGLLGAIPVTSVIVRSSVNIYAGGKTRLAALTHGALLTVSVAAFPTWLNRIPLACLAAILIVTGLKLASPKLFRQMWREGPQQFIPFAVTIVAIVFTDLLVGVVVGLGVASTFILYRNLSKPVRRIAEHHVGGDVLRIELPQQVSFLNRASLSTALNSVPRGTRLLIDARNTDYIDADVVDLIVDYRDETAKAHGVTLSLVGFRDRYQRVQDEVENIDFSTRELQEKSTPQEVLRVLTDGNERFRAGKPLARNVAQLIDLSSVGQHPLAVVLSCIDSRTPAELVFDLGLGDILSVRIAGNVAKQKVLGSMEYGCVVAGAKLIVVMGHTRCGAVNAAVDLHDTHQTANEAFGCPHVDALIPEIQKAIPSDLPPPTHDPDARERRSTLVARENVARTVREIPEQSAALAKLAREGRIAIVGCLYDVRTGAVEFLPASA